MKGRLHRAAVCVVGLALGLSLGPARPALARDERRVILIGVDGMDPQLLMQFVGEGVMPNFERLMKEGDFKPLQTTMPPLSPTAWSTFITGMDPGGHGIFDFLHRDPKTMEPFMATSRTRDTGRTLKLGSWVIPISGGEVELLRKGRTFWQVLEEHDVPTTIFRMPANYPPAESPGKSFSGMGTPDIRGTSGTFSFFTTAPPPNAADISGGEIYEVQVNENRVDAQLIGPPNVFRRFEKESPRRRRSGREEPVEYDVPDMTVDFTVYIDPTEAVAKFDVQGEEFILEQGEWSPWIEVKFEPVPFLVGFTATARFYLQQVRPEFRLYVTPLQINPSDPAMAISTPADWSAEISEKLGLFYTQELPEDTKAFSAGIFSGREFYEQAQSVYRERRRALDYMLERFDEGLLFFYFSSIDQNSHMLYRYIDKDHPGYVEDEELAGGLRHLYGQIDEALGRVFEEVDERTTLIVMSDHGFAPFHRGVNLNTWLLENGYVTLIDPASQGKYPYFTNVDWSKTQAYALGLNGLYVNLRGREVNGIVGEGEEYDRLLEKLERDLLEIIDPKNGKQAVTLVVNTHRDFKGAHVDIGPDIIVGYNRGYRSSWESPLGEFPLEIFVDNTDAWSGDHLMDYRHVPGVLLTNRKITLESPALYDLTVAVLDEFGVEPLAEMIGVDCIGPKPDSESAALRPAEPAGGGEAGG